MKSILKTSLLLLLCVFSSCMTTQLESKEISTDLERLSYANWNPVCINITGETPKSLGHQYLMPFIPVGEIVLDKPFKSFLFSSMFKVLSLAHFSPKFSSKSCKDVLNINIKDVSLTAYDLFFTRRIKGKIKYKLVYTRNGVLYDIKEDAVTVSHYKKYAFKTELEYVLNKLLDEFSNEAVNIMKFF